MALVNGEAVTSEELASMLADPLEKLYLLQELGTGSPEQMDLKHLAVQKLIQRQLYLQEAQRRGLKVTDTELDQALSALRDRFNDLAEFGIWMHDRGLDDSSLLNTLRVQILTTKVWILLTENVEISDELVVEFYEKHKEKMIIGEEVRLRIIAVRDEKTAWTIVGELKSGKNFAQLARQRSSGLRARQGGDTGWINFHNLAPILQQAVRRMEAGDVAGPLQKSPEEYLLVALESRRSLAPQNLEQARSEIEKKLLYEEKQKIIDGWLKEQKQQSDIEILL